MVERKLTKEEREGMCKPYFYDRLYYLIKEENDIFSYSDFVQKIEHNGTMKVLKSLGIYKTIGRSVNKKIFIHPRMSIIIDTTISSSDKISKTILSLGDLDTIRFNIDFNNYEKLKFKKETTEVRYNGGSKTYLIKNNTSGLTKIGASCKVHKRFMALSNKFGKNLVLFGYCNINIEKKLHKELKEKRVFGEWFNLSELDVQEIMTKEKFEVCLIK